VDKKNAPAACVLRQGVKARKRLGVSLHRELFAKILSVALEVPVFIFDDFTFTELHVDVFNHLVAE
jgi:hypothetical protein